MRSETDCVFPALPLQAVRIRPTQSHQHVQFIQPSITRIWQAAISKLRCAESVHISCYIMLLNVGRAATEESTAAAAVGWAPGKTVAIAERSALSTDFPYGQSGTGRLSFRLRLAPPKRQTSGTSITRSARPNARKDCAPCRQAATPADFPNGQSGIRQPSLARSKTCQSPPHGYPQQVASPPLHTNPNPSSVALPPRERSCAHAAAHISEHKKLKTAGHILRSSRAELVAAHKQPATCEQFHHFPPSQKNSKFFINFFPLFATYI